MSKPTSIPHINVADLNMRRILTPMKETIESHVKLINQQATLITNLQNEIAILKKTNGLK